MKVVELAAGLDTPNLSHLRHFLFSAQVPHTSFKIKTEIMSLKKKFLTLLLSAFVVSSTQAQESEKSTRDRDKQEQTARQRDSVPANPPRERKRDFVPQNDRERALFEMIRQLRAEVAELERRLQTRDAGRREELIDRPFDRPLEMRSRERSNVAPEAKRDLEAKRRSPIMQKAQNIFSAYDKNKDRVVSFEEWLAMREGEITSERRLIEQRHFAEPAGDDQKITIEEFYLWMDRRSRGGRREADSQRPPAERERG